MGKWETVRLGDVLSDTITGEATFVNSDAKTKEII